MILGFCGIAGMHRWSGYSHGVDEIDERILWHSTIQSQNFYNSEKFTETLDNWDGYWKQGRQTQKVYQSNQIDPKELQYYLSQDNLKAVGYIRNRSYNILTSQVTDTCSFLNPEGADITTYNSPLDSEYDFGWNFGPWNLFVYGVEKKKYHLIKYFDYLSGNEIETHLAKSDNKNRLKLKYPYLDVPSRPIVWFTVQRIADSQVGPNEDEFNFNREETLFLSEKDNNSIYVSPNPFSEILRIDSQYEDQIEIFNVNGIVVLFQEIKFGETIIDTGRLSTGFYILKSKNTNSTYKLIKY
jgi:hypothetical protein